MLYTKKYTRIHLLRFVILAPILAGSITFLAFRSPHPIALKTSTKSNVTFQKIAKNNVQTNLSSSKASALKPLEESEVDQSQKTVEPEPITQNEVEVTPESNNLVKTGTRIRDSLSRRDKYILSSVVYFYYLEDHFRNDAAKALLKDVAFVLEKHPHINLLLIGHTEKQDQKEDFYQNLSKRRAQSVKAYLQKLGIDDKRLKTVGYGTTDPAASNETAFGRIKNNRVKFVVLEKEGKD